MEEDRWEILRGPQLPGEEELLCWGVAEWMDFFTQHDHHRSPFMQAMASRQDTEQSLLEALEEAKIAEEEHERATREFFEHTQNEPPQGLQEEQDGADEPWSDHDDDDDDDDAPWRASLPELKAYEQSFPSPSEERRERIRQECPPQVVAESLLHTVMDHFRDGDVSPAGHYLLTLLTTTVVGVYMGYYWDEEGYPMARQARYKIATQRFEKIAQLMTAFTDLQLEDKSREAKDIAEGFRGLQDS